MREMGIPQLSRLGQGLVNCETLLELNRPSSPLGANNVTGQLNTPFGGRVIPATSDKSNVHPQLPS